VLGIDVSAAMLAKATERGVVVARADGTRLPCREASIDHAIVVLLFQLVDDHQAFLAELHRVLRHGGRAVIAPVKPERPTDPIGRFDWDQPWGRRNSVERLVAVSDDTGFNVVTVARGRERLEETTLRKEADRRDQLWGMSSLAGKGLRLLEHLDEPIVQDVTWHTLVLQR
jgi:SAM-dependent methyltransferase